MKIISNRKDYYDYMAGIRGIDNHVIFDRRNIEILKYSYLIPSNIITDNEVYRYYIQIGYNAYIFQRSKDYIRLLDKISLHSIQDQILSPISVHALHIPSKYFPVTYKQQILDSLKDQQLWGKQKNLKGIATEYKYLFLSNTYIPSFISAEETYDSIYNFLLSKKDIKIVDNSTDLQKLSRKGFDKVTSFRNPIK